MKFLSIVIKTVERCNIRCTYCYFFNDPLENYRFHPPYISQSTIKDIAQYIKKGCIDLEISHVSIAFHGGEPLMQKKQAFDLMCDTFTKTISPHAQLNFVLQTNGMLIDENWVELFDKYSVSLGISIDGLKSYHDKYRLDKKGAGTYEKVISKLNFAIQHPKINQRDGVGTLTVINPEYSAKKIYRHFVDDLHLKIMDFILPDHTHDNPPSHPIAVYGLYLQELFKEWVQDDNPQISIRFFKSIIGFFLSQTTRIYGVGKHTDTLPVIAISSNGDIRPTDELLSTGAEFMNTTLSASVHSLKETIEHDSFSYVAEQIMTLPTACQNCEWKEVCSGGTIATRYSQKANFDNPSIYCEALKMLFTVVVQYLNEQGVDINIEKEKFNTQLEQLV